MDSYNTIYIYFGVSTDRVAIESSHLSIPSVFLGVNLPSPRHISLKLWVTTLAFPASLHTPWHHWVWPCSSSVSWSNHWAERLAGNASIPWRLRKKECLAAAQTDPHILVLFTHAFILCCSQGRSQVSWLRAKQITVQNTSLWSVIKIHQRTPCWMLKLLISLQT